MCEPQLGRRGLYDSMGGAGERRNREMALLWVLNLSDGGHSLLDIAERSGAFVRLDSKRGSPASAEETCSSQLRAAGNAVAATSGEPAW